MQKMSMSSLPSDALLEILSFALATFLEAAQLKLVNRSFKSAVEFLLFKSDYPLLERLNHYSTLPYLRFKYDSNDPLWSNFIQTYPLLFLGTEEEKVKIFMLHLGKHLGNCLNTPKSEEQLDRALYFMIQNRHYYQKLLDCEDEDEEDEEPGVEDDEQPRDDDEAAFDSHLPVIQDEPIEEVPILVAEDMGLRILRRAFYRFVFNNFRTSKLYYFLRYLKSNRVLPILNISTLSQRIRLEQPRPIPFPEGRYFIPVTIMRLRHLINFKQSLCQKYLLQRAFLFIKWLQYQAFLDLPLTFFISYYVMHCNFASDDKVTLIFRLGAVAFFSILISVGFAPSFYFVSILDEKLYLYWKDRANCVSE